MHKHKSFVITTYKHVHNLNISELCSQKNLNQNLNHANKNSPTIIEQTSLIWFGIFNVTIDEKTVTTLEVFSVG